MPTLHVMAEELKRGRAMPDGAVRLSLDDVQHPPRESFVLGSMIPFEKSSVLYGPTSVGKSALAAQIAVAFSAGARQLWGLPIYRDRETEEHGGPVLVYTAEDSLDDWKRKAAAILVAGGVDVERALGQFYVADHSEGMVRLSEVVTVHAADEKDPGRTVTRHIGQPTKEQDNLIRMVNEVGARFVLVETTSRLVDDEDNASFAALQSALGRVARETRAAVLLTHHATKAASKDNDNAIESARGGGSLIANARNALALFPADAEASKAYRDRFPIEDMAVLAHGKPTSSTRRQSPILLVRCDATWGAVFRTPDEVALTPEQEQANAARVEQSRQREWAQLGRLYGVVEQALPARPSISPSWLRDNCARPLGLAKHRVEPLVQVALQRGVLKVNQRTVRGITVALGVDPRATPSGRADSGESPPGTP